MARNEITPIELSMNAQSSTLDAAVEVDADTGAYVDVEKIDASKLIFEVSSTGANTAFIKDGGTYTGGDVGDLKITTTGEKTYYVGPLETARFKDSDGYISLIGDTDGDTDLLGFRAILLP